jgi:hypothetical protein
MNYGGQPLLSRQTISLGRSLMILSLGVVLTVVYEIDTTGLQLFGVELGKTDLTGPILWTIGTLWFSLLVNWIADVVSLGKWNSAVGDKLADTVTGGGGKLKPKLEYVIRDLEQVSSEDEELSRAIKGVVSRLKSYEHSAWWYEKTAFTYVIVWSGLVPTGLAL